MQVTAAVPGSVVPPWQEALAPAVLASDYQRIMEVLAGGSGIRGKAMDCRQLAAAVGLEPGRAPYKRGLSAAAGIVDQEQRAGYGLRWSARSPAVVL
ncbi:hypothetical protein [Streptomyces sp. NPDC056323]|uniref:hypothetical protein n=1 Tax=unclassified Streptomyces TaxID=2593676 RepID=UPI0035D8B26F